MIKFPFKTENTPKTRQKGRTLGVIYPLGQIPFPWLYLLVNEDGVATFTSNYAVFSECSFPYVSPEDLSKEDYL